MVVLFLFAALLQGEWPRDQLCCLSHGQEQTKVEQGLWARPGLNSHLDTSHLQLQDGNWPLKRPVATPCPLKARKEPGKAQPELGR